MDPGSGTLLDVLAARADQDPDRPAFEFEGAAVSYARLWRELNGFAAALALDDPGERVLIALSTGIDFFAAFYGIQRAGGIPVPLHPNAGDGRLAGVAAGCGARRIVLPPERQGPWTGLERVDAGSRAEPDGRFEAVRPESVAYIQFTSGSTGEPKGVPITHADLLTNIGQMIAGMEITPEDVFVSWLPVYHDMGLVLMTMVPFYLAARLVLLPTSFVNLRSWFTTIDRVRGTFTAAPDFGYRLALRYTARPEEVDLSSLRVALNAAETVRPETVRDFEETFGLTGVMTAGYGLAEATVGVSMTEPGGGVRVDADGFASVGRPFPGIELEILSENGTPARTGERGEVLVRSPANTTGYFGDDVSSRELFWGAGFIRTGDIGYLDAAGELFIVGRSKEMLKHAGQTVAPREVEEAVEGRSELRAAAAVSADLGGPAGEGIVVFCELARPGKQDEADLHDLAIDLTAQVAAHMGFRPARLYLVRPHTIPRTANGKVQRLLLRERYLDGGLRREGLILYPDF